MGQGAWPETPIPIPQGSAHPAPSPAPAPERRPSAWKGAFPSPRHQPFPLALPGAPGEFLGPLAMLTNTHLPGTGSHLPLGLPLHPPDPPPAGLPENRAALPAPVCMSPQLRVQPGDPDADPSPGLARSEQRQSTRVSRQNQVRCFGTTPIFSRTTALLGRLLTLWRRGGSHPLRLLPKPWLLSGSHVPPGGGLGLGSADSIAGVPRPHAEARVPQPEETTDNSAFRVPPLITALHQSTCRAPDVGPGHETRSLPRPRESPQVGGLRARRLQYLLAVLTPPAHPA